MPIINFARYTIKPKLNLFPFWNKFGSLLEDEENSVCLETPPVENHCVREEKV